MWRSFNVSKDIGPVLHPSRQGRPPELRNSWRSPTLWCHRGGDPPDLCFRLLCWHKSAWTTESDSPSVSCVGAERTNSVHLSSRAPSQANAMYVRAKRAQFKSRTHNKSEPKKDKGVHLEATLGTETLQAPANVSSEVSLLYTSCARNSILAQNYWPSVGFSGWLWESGSSVQSRGTDGINSGLPCHAYCKLWPSPSKYDQRFVPFLSVYSINHPCTRCLCIIITIGRYRKCLRPILTNSWSNSAPLLLCELDWKNAENSSV